MSSVPHYAGIGSRQTPVEVLRFFRQMAGELAVAGWHMRTGGAQGADESFMRGTEEWQRSVIVPWAGFEKRSGTDVRLVREEYHQQLYEWAEQCHPAWPRCSQGARKLHTRNAAVIRGEDNGSPVNAVVCWTPDGAVTGGTGLAIRLAQAAQIPVLNAAVMPYDEIRAQLADIASDIAAPRTGAQKELLDALSAAELRIAQDLLATGMDLDFADEHGRTAAHCAGESGDSSMLWLLWGRRAPLYGVDRQGRTVAHVAATAGNYKSMFMVSAVGYVGAISSAEEPASRRVRRQIDQSACVRLGRRRARAYGRPQRLPGIAEGAGDGAGRCATSEPAGTSRRGGCRQCTVSGVAAASSSCRGGFCLVAVRCANSGSGGGGHVYNHLNLFFGKEKRYATH